MRSALALALAAVPLAAWAQGIRPPSLSDSLATMDRLTEEALQHDRAEALAHPEDLDLQQVFVYPERPGQNQVAWFGFSWRYVDVPPPGGGRGGIRLYYYQSEEAQAHRALPAILGAYARLVELFHYNPTRRIPYILYATQREFQAQNVFQVTESVLGVTSPEDLKMTVPYFGDHSRFIEVSTHELVHQFHIQKMRDLAGEDGRSAIDELPLWFIEGIAEYYSKGGVDVETDLFLRDLVWNPDPDRHYQVLSFAEDGYLGYIPTYKLGQARVAFIAEEYGPEAIQGFIERAGQGERGGAPESRGFRGLVRRVLNEPIEQVDARWRAWLKRRTYPAYLEARLDMPGVREIRRLPGEPEAFTTSPDGSAVLYRAIDRKRGRAELVLADPRTPESARRVASDDRPGMESFHPVDYRVMALGAHVLAFSAQDGIGDRLYLRSYRHRPPRKDKPARFTLGKLRDLDVRPPQGGRFVAIADPALSPDERELAFVGVAAEGQQDVYVAPLSGPSRARRLTNDLFAKKDLAWGPEGIVYASDATEHGHTNLFRLDPVTAVRTRLTTTAAKDRYPAPQPDGALLFSSDAGGKPDLWELRDGRTRRLTDFSTGLQAPRAAPGDQGLLAGTFQGGQFRLVQVSRLALLSEPWREVAPPTGEPSPIPSPPFPAEPQVYRSLSARNWRPEAGFVYGGGSSGAISGRAAMLFTDTLRDHVLFFDVSVLGSFDYTEANALYEDRSRRTGLVLGAYHYLQQQLDTRDVNLAFLQREFGVVGALRYPLDRYRRFEVELSLGATERYCPTDFTGDVVLSCSGVPAGSPWQSAAEWRHANGGLNLDLRPAVRYGFDSVRYHPTAGPIDGASLLAELGGGWLPGRSAVHGFFRLDAERYVQLVGRTRFWTRAALGTSFSPGGESGLWQRSFWLTAADNLRGYAPGDEAFLIGTHYWVTNAELQVPLDPILRLPLFEYFTGVAGMDFGGVFHRWSDRRDEGGALIEPGAWGARTLTGVLGVNLTLGPILFRVHFGHPFDIGGVKTPALQHGDRWVTNITLRYLFF